MTVGMRVLIIDDDIVTRRVLKLVLEGDGHIVVGQAGNGSEGLALISRCAPSLVLLDMDMPKMEGLSVLRRLQVEFSWLPVVVLSMLDASLYTVRCMRLGARGYLNKEDGVKLLPALLSQLNCGRMLFPRIVEEKGVPLAAFSDRELICLRCLARGGAVREIVSALMIGTRNAEKLCDGLQAKLGLRSIEELREYGQRLGLG